MTQPSRVQQLHDAMQALSDAEQVNPSANQWPLYKEALRQAREFEGMAEWYRLEAEQAFADVGAMKEQGRLRANAEHDRMLPKHIRAVDHRTNTFKAMQDAKGDFALYLGTMANTYANLAAMKYAKAMAIRPR